MNGKCEHWKKRSKLASRTSLVGKPSDESPSGELSEPTSEPDVCGVEWGVRFARSSWEVLFSRSLQKYVILSIHLLSTPHLESFWASDGGGAEPPSVAIDFEKCCPLHAERQFAIVIEPLVSQELSGGHATAGAYAAFD